MNTKRRSLGAALDIACVRILGAKRYARTDIEQFIEQQTERSRSNAQPTDDPANS